jgi:putative hydrolase of the HAD superfamily
MTDKRFDAVLFDAGGVLVLPDPTVLGPTLAPHGGSLDHAVHHRAHYVAMHELDAAPTADWDIYRRTYVRSCGVPDDELDHAMVVFSATFNAHLWRHPNAGASDALRALAQRRVPIGVVSNASGQIEGALSRASVCQVGDGAGATVLCVVDSHLVGVAKPDPAIFESALDHLGIDRHRVAYVGDSVRYDVLGAEAAGLVPLLLDPYPANGDDGRERITALTDLLDLV